MITSPESPAAHKYTLAREYLREDSYEYSHVESKQYTIPRLYLGYENILNDAGKSLLASTLARVKNGEFRLKFEQQIIVRVGSNNKPDYVQPHFNGPFHNIYIFGWYERKGKCKLYQTSAITLFSDDWCMTKNGNIYKLGKFITKYEYNLIVDGVREETKYGEIRSTI